MRYLLWLLLATLCVGCSGSQKTPPAVSTDETLARETQAGRVAFDLERAKEAAAQYRAALTRAQARDDLEAIGDIGYNLAVVELYANAPERALLAAQAARAELERRGSRPFPALLLVEATALYRSGATAEAERIAAQVEGSDDREAALRATFLRGLIADDKGNEAGLSAAAERLRLAEAAQPALQADAAELAARLALRRGTPAKARQAAERAVALRRESLDYRGLARVLAIAGESAAAQGDAAAAAGFFLRAGRSAAAQGNTVMARSWLKRATALAPNQPEGETAGMLLRGLTEKEG